jgi:CheY-like chemotaxis protein
MARILIVDDDPSFGELARQTLTRRGHKVDFQQGAFGTLNKAKGGYDIILLDVYMPALNGTRLIQELRRTAGLENLKILLVSSMDPEPLRELAEQHEADGFVTKSTTRDQFIGAVEAALRSPAGGSPARRAP